MRDHLIDRAIAGVTGIAALVVVVLSVWLRTTHGGPLSPWFAAGPVMAQVGES